MSVVFQEGVLSDIARVTMGQSPKKEFVSSTQEGLPLLNGPTEFGSSHPTPVQWSTSFSKTAEPGDILFCVRGSTTGRMNWADQQYAIGRGIASISAINPQERHFVRAAIDLVLPELLAAATGSTFPNVSRLQLSELPVALPSAAVRTEISGLLGALDDKIESNRQVCSLIDLLATELFCDRFTVHTRGETSDLMTIDDIGEIVGGGTPSKKVEEYYADSGIAWLTPRDLSKDRSIFRQHGELDISELGLRKSSARLLPRGTVLFTSRAPIGYIAIASGETSTNQGFKSIVPHPEFGTAFTFYLLKQLTPEIVSSANGSTFKEISKGGLASISFDAPDRASVREFNSLVQPLLDLQEAKESETCRLSKLRDALLPELMSGRMRVDEAGCLVSEALDKEVADV